MDKKTEILLEEIIFALKNAKPHLQNIVNNNRAGGLLPENAITNLLIAVERFEQNENN